MEDVRITLACPRCKRSLGFPGNKHIRFSCPYCDGNFEYDQGSPIYQPGLSDSGKALQGNDYKLWLISTAAFLLLIFSFLYDSIRQHNLRLVKQLARPNNNYYYPDYPLPFLPYTNPELLLDVDEPIKAAPFISDSALFLCSEEGDVSAYNIASLERMWQLKLDGGVRNTPVAFQNNLLVGTEQGLYKIEANTGKVLDTLVIRTNSEANDVTPIISRLVRLKGEILFAGLSTIYLAEIHNKLKILASFNLNEQFLYGPIYQGDQVFVATADSGIVGLRLNDGRFKQDWRYKNNSSIAACPTIYKDTIYVADENGRVLLLNSGNGNCIGSFDTYNRIYASILAIKDVFFVTGSSILKNKNYLHVFKKNDKHYRHDSIELTAPVFSPLIYLDNSLLLAEYGKLDWFETDTSKREFNYERLSWSLDAHTNSFVSYSGNHVFLTSGAGKVYKLE